ncbi:MAG TPA: geranylgeranylglyceryl/heptaprenylglyceryl phosphate synthase [Candidatus Deferrimicrobium sp.]|nr:geranylgeranylglyceryl/heptaprenylglyceryl phosphate synthase [Candidatus Deferrimicrobium sp.]
MYKNRVWEYFQEKLKTDRALHMSLIDPDLTFQTINNIKRIVKYATDAGTDAFMVGGSTIADQISIDKVIVAIKEETDRPVIVFPGNVNAFSKNADATFFMSLINSNNLYWVIRSHVLGAPTLKLWNLEPISLAYIIIEPGATAGFIGEAHMIPRNKPKIAAAYALAAQYIGFKMVYLEAGSGANETVPVEMVKVVTNFVDIPVFVGGGINTKEQAVEFVKAGAKLIVQGTYLEKVVPKDKGAELTEIIKAIKNTKK